MNDLLDIYTKIKLRIGSEIIVTYYKCGSKLTRCVILENINELEYIVCSDGYGDLDYLSFFDKNMLIESIYVPDYGYPLYYNPYINQEIFKNFYVDNNSLLDIKKMMFGKNSINFEDNAIFYKKFKERDKLLDKYIARYFNVEFDELFFSDKQKEQFDAFFEMLTSELSSYAKRNNMDNELKFIESGTTSLVYEIGDKFLKIGKARRFDYIPYCEYVLQPIINRNFCFDGYPIHIEVTQKVLVLKDKDGKFAVSRDRCQRLITKLKKDLDSIGIMARDLHMENVGILLEDNKIHYDLIDVDVCDDIVTSIENNNNLKILKKGKLVIIDLDCLRIADTNKYMKYLKRIGFSKDKIDTVPKNSKCLVRR